MSDVVELRVPCNNVNDDSAFVVALLVEQGAAVVKDQPVLEIETSKTTVQMTAPAAGIIRFLVEKNTEVPNGELLALIGETPAALEACSGKASAAKQQPEKTATASGTSLPQAAPEIEWFVLTGTDGPGSMCEWLVVPGSTVQPGEPICRVRCAGGLRELSPLRPGIVQFLKTPLTTIAVGEKFAFVAADRFQAEALMQQWKAVSKEPAQATIPPPAVQSSPARTVTAAERRFSRKAQEWLLAKGIKPEEIRLSGLITVRRLSGEFDVSVPATSLCSTASAASMVVPEHAVRLELTKAKRNEGKLLSAANHEAVISQISVNVPTRRIFTRSNALPEWAGNMSARILLECATLLKRYPLLRSFWLDGTTYTSEEINIGYALCMDDGLKVPVLHHCDRKSLDEIISEKQRFVQNYLEHQLTAEQLSGGSFTITDLSNGGAGVFQPVLNFRQSAILGIGGETPDGRSYPLMLAFDHRIADGMYALDFLNELKSRLTLHEKQLSRLMGEAGALPPSVCHCCGRTPNDLALLNQHLLKEISADGEEQYLCSICLRGM